MPPAAPAAPARSLPRLRPGANTRPAMSPTARNGTNTPPQPPAATAAVVAIARRTQTASRADGSARVLLSAQRIAPPPGPTAAVGVAMRERISAVATIAAPPTARRTAGEAFH